MPPEKVLDSESSILSGLVPLDTQPTRVESCFKNIDLLLSRVALELFNERNQMLIGLIVDCRRNYNPLSEDILVDFLQRKGVEGAALVDFQDVFDKARRAEISEGKFRYVIDIFLKDKEEELFQLKLADAFSILKDGKKIGQNKLKGVSAARQFLVHSMYEFDRVFLQDVPAGNIRDDGKEVWAEYLSRKSAPQTFEGTKTGFSIVDNLTNGFIPGELGLIAAYAGQGKSNTTMNMIYHAAVVQGKNVVVAVNEMVYRQYRTRLFIRHTCNPIFGIPDGIPYQKFKMGNMNPVEEKAFQAAVQDFESNPNYGRVEVFQIPSEAGFPYLAARLAALESIFHVDIFFCDYLQLLGKPGKNEQRREYLDQLLREAKRLAVSFNRGKGIPVVSPWQINRQSFKDAQESGKYTLTCMAEASEGERSPDFIMWLLRRDEEIAKSELKAGILKYRDGTVESEFTLFEGFESYYVGDVRTDVGGSPVIGAGGNSLY